MESDIKRQHSLPLSSAWPYKTTHIGLYVIKQRKRNFSGGVIEIWFKAEV